MAVPLTIACDLNDRTRAIHDGSIRPRGIDLTTIDAPVEEVFWRMLRHAEFDAAEMSMSSYMMTRERSSPDLIAIPAFPSRFFRHSCIFVNADAGIDEPGDLRGATVGVPEYQITAAVWIRGMLDDDYGVSPDDMRWVHGGEEEAGREEKLPLPDDVEIDAIPGDATLSELLAAGDIDALVTARTPSSFSTDAVERLFPDFRAVERDYYDRTGIFPIMHAVVLRRDVYDANPWIAQELYQAFYEAKEACLAAIGETEALSCAVPWLRAEMEDTWALMGEDYWPYGVERNRHTLETLIRYEHEQGLIAERPDPEDLFAPEALDEFRI